MKLLLISAAAGAGHVRAAEAIKKQTEIDHPDWQIEHIDLLDYLSIPSKKIFFDSYGMIIKKAPFLWGLICRIFNRPEITKISDQIVKGLIIFHAQKITNYINVFKPDIIICTHPTATNIVTTQEKNLVKKPQLWTVVTDYKMHLFWINQQSKYFVPNEENKIFLINNHNFKKENIVISGIPVDNIFYKKEENNLKNKYSLNENPTILLLSGGEGLIKSDKIAKEIIKQKIPLNLIAIAGKNIKLKEKLKNIIPPANINYEAIGWTEKISDYMKMADIIITKPGGMTITECLTLNKPIIIIHPIPGQEEYNTEFLLKNKLAQVCHKNKNINKILEEILKQKPTINWSAKNGAQIIVETVANTNL